jgi:2-polyprenyl-3-methyl-5-hydroxy-6-metoxy-1,4-benzoquinol methylase
MASRFHVRKLQQELMDDPTLDETVHRNALSGLRRINWLSRTDSAVWNALRPLFSERSPTQPLTILDIASGGGDLAIRLARRAKSEGLNVKISGCDISPTAIEFASEQAKLAQLPNVSFHRCNVLTDPLPEPAYDVVMCSLFLHHLDENDGLRLLTCMKSAAKKMVLVDDLHRSAAGYWLAWLGCRILTRCHVVHVDGPMSVEGALTSAEAKTLAVKAGMTEAIVKHHWPQRFLLSWKPK